MNPNDGEGTESWLARRERVKLTAQNGNGMGMPLAIAVQLLPTPVVTDSAGARNATSGRKDGSQHHSGTTLTDAITLLPTPRTTDMNGPGAHGQGGVDLRTAVAMFPTPRATRGGSNTEIAYALGGERSNDGRVQGQVLLPTPMTSYSQREAGAWLEGRPAGNGQRRTIISDLGIVAEQVVETTDWGQYAAAVARWEQVCGRKAPAPVRNDGRGGKARLNPELPEWMMGWPAGWVTDPAIGLSRSEQLKACGNGVVPQQAIAAITELLSRPGVPNPVTEEA